MVATPIGYAVQRYEDRRAALVERWRTAYGPNANTASDTVDGLLIDLICRMAQYADEQGFRAYNAHWFHTAQGLELDAILAPLFGSKRLQPRGSVAEVLVYGEPGAEVLEGALVSTSDRGDVFRVQSTIDIDASVYAVFVYAGSASLTATSLKINGQEYSPLAPTSGTGLEVAQHASSIMGSPDGNWEIVYPAFEDVNGRGVVVVRMSAPWAIVANSSSADAFAWYGALGLAQSEDTGPVPGEALSITRINTPLSDWQGVVNLDPVTLGDDEDTDPEYRARHLLELGRPANATPMGLQAKLYSLTGVELVRMYFNFTGANPDAFGRPSHSFEPVVQGGAVEDIAKTIWLTHTTGTQSFGNLTTTIVDSRDQTPRVISFSRPTLRFVWVDITIEAGEGFPSTAVADIEADVAARILAWGQGLRIGQDLYIDTIKQQVQVPGVRSITVELGTTLVETDPKPVLASADLVFAETELSRWAVTRIGVEVV